MTTRFPAHFDGEHVCPDEPVELPIGKKLWVTVEEAPMAPASNLSLKELFDRIESETGLMDGPVDWAAQHDHYLYGTPKKHGTDGE